MPNPRDFLPLPPWEGPPLPRKFCEYMFHGDRGGISDDIVPGTLLGSEIVPYPSFRPELLPSPVPYTPGLREKRVLEEVKKSYLREITR